MPPYNADHEEVDNIVYSLAPEVDLREHILYIYIELNLFFLNSPA